MKIYVKDDCNDHKTFEDIAYRIGLFNVYNDQRKNILAIWDDYYEVNDGGKEFERCRLYRIRQLIDLINICETLEIKLLITNDNEMSKELFFEICQSQVHNDVHEFETGLSVPAWIAEGFDSRHAWEEDNQHDADADTSNDLDETHKYFNI
tara:strand:- start:2 stop:454 length:453 start_codon:yes stop_codon:yes gene_type:complete